MRHLKPILLLVVLALIVQGALSTAEAQEQTLINGAWFPGHPNLTYNGGTATVTADLQGVNLVILESNVVLDGLGHKLLAEDPATGILISSGLVNVTVKNFALIKDFGNGIEIASGASSCKIHDNTFDRNVNGIAIVGASSNLIYHNNFVGNTQGQDPVSVVGFGNSFSQPLPVGGNYWSNLTNTDSNGDGIVDAAYSFPGGTDSFPWATVNGWATGSTTDTEPPVTTHTSNPSSPGPTGWFTTNVRVELQATDAGSGVKSTSYALDNGAWTVYNPLPAINVTTDGLHDVAFRSEDNAGNIETAKNLPLKIDKTAPVTTASPSGTAGANGWFLSDVSVTLAATDATSGVATTEFSLGNNTWSTGNPPAFTQSGMLYYRSKDVAGNTETAKTLEIKIDKVPPTIISTNRTPGANIQGWNNSPVTASYVASDAGSGLVSTTGTHEFNGEGAGQSHTFVVTDRAGNQASVIIENVNIDLTLPTISFTRTPPNANGWNNTEVTVTYTAEDALSGLADSSPPTHTLTSEGGGQSVTFEAIDKAGNTNTITVDGVNIDMTPPTTTASLSGTLGTNGWYNSNVSVSLTGADVDVFRVGMAGISKTEYSFDNTTWALPPVPPITQGRKVYFRSTDKAGNVEDAKSVSVQINPTIGASAGPNGSISPSGTVYVNNGENKLFTFTPNTGYHVAEVVVDDGPSGAAGSYSFTNVTGGHTISVSFAIDQFTLAYTAGTGGTIEGSTSQTVNYNANGTAVRAVPDAGYSFVNWSDGSTSNPRTDINVKSDVSVTANFAINTFTLTYAAGANGTISGTSPQTVGYGLSGSAVTAVANTGYHFVDWSDGVATDARTDLTVNANLSVTANFAINKYALSVTATNGTVAKNPDQTEYNYGTTVELTATPATGYRFVDWTGDATGSTNPVSIAMDGNKNVTANFAITTFTLTYAAGANGTISGTSPQTVGYGLPGSAVTAVGNTGYHFVDWSDGSTANPRTDANVTADISVTANFAIDATTPKGFVTGGGWINSPAGAYPADLKQAGKANFGFNAKYETGSSVPSGNLEFQLKTALKFKASSFDMLTVSGANAQVSGSGKNNGSGNYGFALSVIDGKIIGNKIDKLRLRIWNKINNAVVYDNEIGAGETAPPTLPLGGGSITVHKSGDVTTASMDLGDALEATEEIADVMPTAYALHNAYPNPFNPATTIQYDLPEETFVSLKVFDLLGREMATLINGTQRAGTHTIRFNANSMQSGVYIYRIQTAQFSQTKKLVLVK
jgi:uncharacterized repeat protein (TIGR02543 family)